MIDLTFEIRNGDTVTDTIDFCADGYQVLDGYFPNSGDGANPVTDAFDVLIKGTSDSDLELKVQTIEWALNYAKDHPSGPDGVWVLYSPQDDNIDSWQSRLSGGSLLHNDKLDNRWRGWKVRAQVVFTRAPYWETEEPVTLELTNRAGTGNTAALLNHQDATSGHDIYVEIASTEVDGVLPTPAIIEYTNTVDDATLVDNLIIGHFAASGANEPPSAGSLIFEGAGTGDGNCSGGSYAGLSWSIATEYQITSWSFASAAFRQRSYRILARLRDATAYTDLYLKAKLLSGSTVLAETRWSLIPAGPELVVIGSIQIPPFNFGSEVDFGNLTLGLYDKRAAGAGTLNLDYVAAIPQDGWRKLAAITGLAHDETLIDNPVFNTLTTLYSSTLYKVTHLVEEGKPIMLLPGMKNVLYVLCDQTSAAAPIARTATLAVKCHPRRVTV